MDEMYRKVVKFVIACTVVGFVVYGINSIRVKLRDHLREQEISRAFSSWKFRAFVRSDGVAKAIPCFYERIGRLPRTWKDIIESGCMNGYGIGDLDISSQRDMDHPIIASGRWSSIEDIAFRSDEGDMSSDSIVAIVIPFKGINNDFVICITRDGRVEYITRQEWNVNQTEIRGRLGGIDLFEAAGRNNGEP